MPILDIPRACASPPKLLLGVMKSKISNLVLDIVVHQVLAHLLTILVIGHIESAPVEALWKWSFLLWGIFRFEFLDLSLFSSLNFFSEFHDRLSIPEFVFAHDMHKMFVSVPVEEMDRLILRKLQ